VRKRGDGEALNGPDASKNYVIKPPPGGYVYWGPCDDLLEAMAKEKMFY
jgi:hypothetical protein